MGRLVLASVALVLALILGSTAAYGVIWLPAFTSGTLAVGIAIIATCGLLAVSLLVVAALLLIKGRVVASPK